MSYKISAIDLDKSFIHAHRSLWIDKNAFVLTVEEQKNGWRQKFKAKITGGYFGNSSKKNSTSYNNKEVSIEFRSKKDYVLFMMEWS